MKEDIQSPCQKVPQLQLEIKHVEEQQIISLETTVEICFLVCL